MNPTSRAMRPLLLVGVATLALAAVSGCSWIKNKTHYQASKETNPVQGPPDPDPPEPPSPTPPRATSGAGPPAPHPRHPPPPSRAPPPGHLQSLPSGRQANTWPMPPFPAPLPLTAAPLAAIPPPLRAIRLDPVQTLRTE